MALSQKQLSFISYFMELNNATQAAIKAGYSPKTAQEQSSRLLSKAMVKEEIAKRQALAAKASTITSAYLIEETKRILEHCKQVEEGRMTSAKDSLKAIELIGKLGGLMVEKIEAKVQQVKVLREDVATE